jgi:hypothetical protein
VLLGSVRSLLEAVAFPLFSLLIEQYRACAKPHSRLESCAGLLHGVGDADIVAAFGYAAHPTHGLAHLPYRLKDTIDFTSFRLRTALDEAVRPFATSTPLMLFFRADTLLAEVAGIQSTHSRRCSERSNRTEHASQHYRTQHIFTNAAHRELRAISPVVVGAVSPPRC